MVLEFISHQSSLTFGLCPSPFSYCTIIFCAPPAGTKYNISSEIVITGFFISGFSGSGVSAPGSSAGLLS
jgi:hypothetical protein